MSSINIKLAIEPRLKKRSSNIDNPSRYVCPGDTIANDSQLMRGHGTYLNGDKIVSSVAGIVERVNKLIRVRPLKSRYSGEIGDIVIGRIVDVQQKRWKVDVNAHMDSILMLSSIILPSGEMRKKTIEDEFAMAEFLKVDDLISAEVHSIFSDGALSLYSRSAKYGKLGMGILVEVPPTLVKRCKTHFHTLPCGASIILGHNGYIWLSPVLEEAENITISREVRDMLARVRNCVLALAEHKILIFDTTIMEAYEASLPFTSQELLLQDIQLKISEQVRENIEKTF